MDLGKLDTTAACDKGAEIELKHPVSNTPLGAFITVLGKDSTLFKEHTRTLINSRIRKEAMAQKRGKDSEIRTMEQIEKENIETLVVCTTGWRTGAEEVLIVNGTKVPFTVANAIQIYTDYPFIYAQVDEAIGELENFMRV